MGGGDAASENIYSPGLLSCFVDEESLPMYLLRKSVVFSLEIPVTFSCKLASDLWLLASGRSGEAGLECVSDLIRFLRRYGSENHRPRNHHMALLFPWFSYVPWLLFCICAHLRMNTKVSADDTDERRYKGDRTSRKPCYLRVFHFLLCVLSASTGDFFGFAGLSTRQVSGIVLPTRAYQFCRSTYYRIWYFILAHAYYILYPRPADTS